MATDGQDRAAIAGPPVSAEAPPEPEGSEPSESQP